MPKVRSAAHVRRLSDLTSDPNNANLGTARGRKALAHSLREFGPGRAVLLDRHCNIIAGNKTVEEAKRLNIPLRIVKTDGNVLVAVQREDLDLLTDSRAKELAIADNRVGELDLQWDPALLTRLRSAGVRMEQFWAADEWAQLTGSLAGTNPADDRVIEPGPTTIVLGDLFALDRHRLLCGDATAATDVTRLLNGATPALMETDPPFGVGYAPIWRHLVNPNQRTAVGRVMNDDRSEWTPAWKLFPGTIAYVWHAALKAQRVALDLETAGFKIRSQIIWYKQHFAISRGDYHWGHEPAWYAVRGKGRWCGDRRQSTVWNVPNLNAMGGTRTDDNAPTGHGTQKPVRLFEIPILNHTSVGDTIYDPFVGSGTAVIAAEKLSRTAYVMDIDPKYVQVVITRWETFTGKKARRIGRAPSRRNV